MRAKSPDLESWIGKRGNSADPWLLALHPCHYSPILCYLFVNGLVGRCFIHLSRELTKILENAMVPLLYYGYARGHTCFLTIIYQCLLCIKLYIIYCLPVICLSHPSLIICYHSFNSIPQLYIWNLSPQMIFVQKPNIGFFTKPGMWYFSH